MIEDDLKTLAEAIHAITYTVPGLIVSFMMEFDDAHVWTEWDAESSAYVVKQIDPK